MRKSQFFSLLRETRGWGWSESPKSGIRCNGEAGCPITAVHLLVFGVSEDPGCFEKAAEKLGLRKSTATEIVLSADGSRSFPLLRRKIKNATGLTN